MSDESPQPPTTSEPVESVEIAQAEPGEPALPAAAPIGDDSSEPASSPPPAARKKKSDWKPESWGHAARAVCVLALIGMAFAVLSQLSFGGEWTLRFLRDNKIVMHDRMMLIYQLLGAGGVFALLSIVSVLYSKKPGRAARNLEQWAWFLSPSMLLPAIPVCLQHEAWAGKHEDFLPIILFGAILCEFLFSKALANVPPAATLLFGALQSTPEPNEDKSNSLLSRLSRFAEKHSALIVVVLAAVAYGAFMSFYTVRWHEKLGTATFDLGINNNLLYGGLEGKFNQSPVIFPEDPQKYLANHVKIGLYTFLPIYALHPKPETLLILQSISLGLSAIPLFLFAKRRLPAWWAAALALVYLAYYPMHGANFYEMKVVPTSAALVLTCIWAIDAKRFIIGGIFFVWALIMREDMPVPLAVVGAVFLLSGKRPKSGLVMTAVASTWFVLLRFRFMNEVGSWWFPNMYEDLWAHPDRGFQGVIKTLLSNPSFTLKHIFVEKKFWYLMHLLVPMAFVPVRRWWAWAALVPGAILTLLVTDYAPPTMFSFQYVMHWSPYLFCGAALVLASMAKEQGRVRALAALIAMSLASMALSYNYGAFSARDKALESGYHKITFSMSDKERAALQDVRKLVASLPAGASVGSTERVGAHLSSRVGFYTLRRGSHGVDFMVARKKGLRLDRTKQTIRDALESGKYGVEARFGDFVVFKKGGDTKNNKKLIREWRLRTSAKKKRSKKSRAERRRAAKRQKEKLRKKAEAEKAKKDTSSSPKPAPPREAPGQNEKK